MMKISRILQILAAGAVFILVVPLAAVYFAGTMDADSLQNIPQEKPELSDGSILTPDTVTVWMEEKGRAVKVDFEEYVCCVVASEMPASFETEALKAQSVAARTYVMAKLLKYEEAVPQTHPKAPVCDTTHCQVYKTEADLISCHQKGWEEEGWKKIQKACNTTEGELLYYEGELVMQPLFFSSSGGRTENAEDVFSGAYPYLVSVYSPYEENATHQNEEKRFSLSEFERKLKQAYPQRQFGMISRDTIKILSRTAGGRVSAMEAGDGEDGILKGTEVRTALGLSSCLFTIRFEGEDILFTSSGSGHGVGMSQYGADGMASEGYSYREILQHYYSGTEIA